MAEPLKIITKVWIAPGCIICDACETECPEVFEVQDESSTIRTEAMNIEFLLQLSQSIVKAAEACPVEVIKFEAQAMTPEASDSKIEAAPVDSVIEAPIPPAPEPFVLPSPASINELANAPLDQRLALLAREGMFPRQPSMSQRVQGKK
jgi:ferredoxin